MIEMFHQFHSVTLIKHPNIFIYKIRSIFYLFLQLSSFKDFLDKKSDRQKILLWIAD